MFCIECLKIFYVVRKYFFLDIFLLIVFWFFFDFVDEYGEEILGKILDFVIGVVVKGVEDILRIRIDFGGVFGVEC